MKFHLLGTGALSRVEMPMMTLYDSMLLTSNAPFFYAALDNAKALLLLGGGSPEHIAAYKKWGRIDLSDLRNKEVYAFSAGISVLTAHSFNFDHYTVVDGLGLIQACSVVHYNPLKWWAAEYLQLKYGLPVLTIADDEMVVVDEKGNVLERKQFLPPPIAGALTTLPSIPVSDEQVDDDDLCPNNLWDGEMLPHQYREGRCALCGDMEVDDAAG